MATHQKRIRDFGITVGTMSAGALNKITDVAGVRVGHATIRMEAHKTGVTIILPCEDNPFVRKPVAAAFVHNGFGKTTGLPQIDELGTIETPVALTNTLNVGLVHDAIVDYMVRRCENEGVPIRSVNPVVGECNDSSLNRITERVVTAEQVREAFANACVNFEEGDVGAGTGTVCYGLKGGIGSASRQIQIEDKAYTLGVLVQSNYGSTKDFLLNETRYTQPMGRQILAALEDTDRYPAFEEAKTDQGSIIMVVATDLLVNERQLKRIIRRCGVGLARLGSFTGHGSGEIMLGFTTANAIPVITPEPHGEVCPPYNPAPALQNQTILREELLDDAFRAAAEATEEAVLNSMVCAHTVTGLNGKIYYSLSEFL